MSDTPFNSISESEYGNQKCACFIEIESLTAQRDALLALLGKERDEFGKKETELKASLQKATSDHCMDVRERAE